MTYSECKKKLKRRNSILEIVVLDLITSKDKKIVANLSVSDASPGDLRRMIDNISDIMVNGLLGDTKEKK